MKHFSMMMFVVSLIAFGSLAQAAVIGVHSADLDPTDEGWVLDAAGGDPAVGPGADELLYRQIVAEAEQGRYLYNTDAASLSDPSGWTLTGVVKLNDAAYINDCNIAVLDSASWWTINLTTSGAHTWNTAFAYESTLSTLDPTDGYHIYQIQYNPGGDAVNYYIDGTFVGGQARGNVPSGYGIYRAEFGDSNGLTNTTDSQWASVVLETGQITYSNVNEVPGVVVPEPSTLVMLVLGSLALGLGYFRKR